MLVYVAFEQDQTKQTQYFHTCTNNTSSHSAFRE